MAKEEDWTDKLEDGVKDFGRGFKDGVEKVVSSPVAWGKAALGMFDDVDGPDNGGKKK